MDQPSSPALEQLNGFSAALTGTLRPVTIVERLVAAVESAFRPEVLAVGLYDMDSSRIRVLHSMPAELPDPAPILDHAMRRGTRLTTLDQLLPPGTIPWAGAPESWMTVAFESGRIVTGSLIIGGPTGRYTRNDLVFLQSFTGIANVALEASRLVDQAAFARRSWAETVDAITLALALVDDRGRVLRANRAFADLVQTSTRDLVGRPWATLVPAGWSAAVEEALEHAGTGREVDVRFEERSYAVTAFTTGPELHHRVLVFLDRTERRRLQEQLIQSEKMSAVGQLVAGVAHDLNNPLASVLGFADFLVESPDTPSSLREPVRVIQQESLRAATIVRNLLSFARKQEHRRAQTDLGSLLEATLVLMRNQLMADKVEVELDIEPGLPPLLVNANQIQQVLVNLVNNATQAITSSGTGSRIRISVQQSLEGIQVDVADDGPGMSEAMAAHVFEPFFTTKPEGVGTGLGLNICQGIVKEHGGRITLVTAPGAGATFSILLPAEGAQESAHANEPVEQEPGRPLRILLVDDEPHILHYLRTTLEAWGHTVESAPDGEAGLRMALAGRYELIISDLRMPRLGGQEFYQQLVSKNPAMGRHVVFSTGDTLRDDALEFLEREGRPWLNKPFSLAELRKLLARASGELSHSGRTG